MTDRPDFDTMSAMITIYRAVFPNGKCYVGQTKRWPRRRQRHISDAASGKHCNAALSNALRKYGDAVKWEVVAKVIPEWANAAEQNAILASGSMSPAGYNLREGGDCAPVSEETRAKQSRQRKGRRHTEATKRKMSTTRKGKPQSEAHKAARAASLKGKKYRKK